MVVCFLRNDPKNNHDIHKKQKNQKNMLKTTTKRSLEFGTTSVLAHARLVLLVELLAEGGVVGVLGRWGDRKDYTVSRQWFKAYLSMPHTSSRSYAVGERLLDIHISLEGRQRHKGLWLGKFQTQCLQEQFQKWGRRQGARDRCWRTGLERERWTRCSCHQNDQRWRWQFHERSYESPEVGETYSWATALPVPKAKPCMTLDMNPGPRTWTTSNGRSNERTNTFVNGDIDVLTLSVELGSLTFQTGSLLSQLLLLLACRGGLSMVGWRTGGSGWALARRQRTLGSGVWSSGTTTSCIPTEKRHTSTIGGKQSSLSCRKCICFQCWILWIRL